MVAEMKHLYCAQKKPVIHWVILLEEFLYCILVLYFFSATIRASSQFNSVVMLAGILD